MKTKRQIHSYSHTMRHSSHTMAERHTFLVSSVLEWLSISCERNRMMLVGVLSGRPQTQAPGGSSVVLLFSPLAAVDPACGRSGVQEGEGHCPPEMKGGRRELHLSSPDRDKLLTCVLRVRWRSWKSLYLRLVTHSSTTGTWVCWHFTWTW